ncbi:MAG: ABC transporter ATP-binding protein [Bacteroidota bacterium]
MIIAKDIYKSYGNLGVLKGINLEIKDGEIISIVGSSGAGKSTLLHILGTLDKQDKGDVIFDNINITNMNEKQLSLFRNKNIGFIYQFHQLLPEFTALENICIPAFIAGIKKKEAENKAFELLDFLNLKDRASHKPNELSGGEQQRIAVARALINQPKVILADEPSGNLDSATAKELHSLFFELRKTMNQTFIIVTHNNELADMADRKLQMKDGKII